MAVTLLLLLVVGGLVAKPLPVPYAKWLDQDVRYIITSKERADFLALSTNEARRRFVEEFWRKRDPTPATPENEFKVEHYRRVGYAQMRFGTWKSDRARIYIVQGPPDRIESYPRDGVEIWFYRRGRDETGSRASFEFVKLHGHYELKTGTN